MRLKKAGSIVFKIALLLVLTAAVMVGMLKVLETSGDPLRQGIERYLADATHSHAYLRELPDPAFFPDVRITMKGIVLTDKDDPEKTRASADMVMFAMPFLNVLGGTKAVEDIRIEKLIVEKDVMLPHKITLDFAGIDKEAAVPALIARGRYAGKKLSVRVDLASRRKEGRTLYNLPAHTLYNMELGGVTLTGALESRKNGVFLQETMLTGGKGGPYGPASFLFVKEGEFVNDNPVSCLLEHADTKIGPDHPCARLFQKEKDAEESAVE